MTCFYKDTDEVRADLEFGGLGPGLTGEHTIYSFVVCRHDNAEEDEKHMKRWVIKKRYSHFHIFDKVLMQIIKEEGGDEEWLPEVPPTPTPSHIMPIINFTYCMSGAFDRGLGRVEIGCKGWQKCCDFVA